MITIKFKENFAESFLIKRFISTPEKTDSPAVRAQYGTLSGICGILCNMLLFLLKIVIGVISNSAAVISDAFNNLSDCANCIVTLLGCRIASKPADKAHPYGHGRAEYLAALIISAAIFTMGLILFKNSAERIFFAQSVNISVISVIILAVSVIIKLMMYRFNRILSGRISSSVLLAAAKDSLSDAVSTLTVLISAVLSNFIDFPFDGIAGAAVSVFIIKTGLDIIRAIVDELIGKAASPELIHRIRTIVMSEQRALGVHDIMIHTYGPAKSIGSCHVEFDSSDSFAEVHEHADNIERKIKQILNIDMSVHMDPVAVNDALTERCRRSLSRAIENIDRRLSFHDFRIASHGQKTVLIFDLCIPEEVKYTEKELYALLVENLDGCGENTEISVTFDKAFNEE